MTKIKKEYDWYVEVEPRSLGDYGYGSVSDRLVVPDEQERQKEYRERCEEMAEQIKRHVDGVRYVTVKCTTEWVCSHCGWEWEEADGSDPSYPKGLPLCCDTAQKEWEDAQKENAKSTEERKGYSDL